MTLSTFLWSEGTRIAALVGAGGKTTLMRQAVEERASDDPPLVLTTTTRLQRPCPVADAILSIGDIPPDPGGLNPGTARLWVKEEIIGGTKWSGPSLEVLNRFIRDSGNSSFAAGPMEADQGTPADQAVRARMRVRIIIEADGSAGRPVKAPGPREPVLPAGADTVVAVLGLSAIGRPASSETVHRFEPFARIAGVRPGRSLDAKHILRLIAHEDGMFRGVPSGVKRLLVLNQADDGAGTAMGLSIARDALELSGGPHAIAVAALCIPDPIRHILKP